MGDAPAERDVEVEEIRQFCCCLACVRVTPCAERNQNLFLLVESHVTVHHGTDPYGGEVFYLDAILCLHIVAQGGVAVLQTLPDSLDAIGPQTILQLVLPGMGALRYRLVLIIDEDGLDTGRAELYSENGFTLLYSFFCCHVPYLSALLSI